MSPTRCACIDIGSNTTALLVADVSELGLETVATERSFTMLGAAGSPSTIAEDKIDEVAEAVAVLIRRAAEHGVEAQHVAVVATHAVREADNRDRLIGAVESRSGLPVEVIDGHREARYSFIGAVGGLHRVTMPTVVIDAGGGSTEVAWCQPGDQPETASIAIGSASLRRRFFGGDPPQRHEIAAALAHAADEFAKLRLPAGLTLALAVGGGASTAHGLTGGLLDADGIGRVLELTTTMSSDDFAQRFQLPGDRAQLLPSGLAILDAFRAHVGADLEVGRGGVREGLLIDRHGGS